MRYNLLLFLMIILTISVGYHSNAQVQIGSPIDGINAEDLTGSTVAFSADGMCIGIASPGSVNSTGHVSVYVWQDDDWAQVGDHIIGDLENDNFGTSISLSEDGNRIAVGTLNPHSYYSETDHVRIYEWSDNSWNLMDFSFEKDDYYNLLELSVSLSADGNRLAVATHFGGSGDRLGTAQSYEWQTDKWMPIGDKIYGNLEFNMFGSSISLSANGNLLMIGDADEDFGTGEDLGSIRIYEWNNDNWSKTGTTIRGVQDNNEIGTFATMSSDGSQIAFSKKVTTGAQNIFVVQVLEWNGDNYAQYSEEIIPFALSQTIGQQHLRVSLSSNGNTLAIADPLQLSNGVPTGKVVLYKRNGNNWSQIGTAIEGNSSGDFSGSSICLSDNGNRIVIGSPFNKSNGYHSGQARVYSLDNITSTSSLNSTIIDIYPNPASDYLNIRMDEIQKVKILDRLGQLIISKEDPKNQIDISSLASGIYFLQMYSGENIQVAKFVKE